MPYDPDIHHRRSIRLAGYDYSQAGAYFVTICIQNHECLLGQATSGIVTLNAAGEMVQRVWLELPEHYGVAGDAFVVMPNHVHWVVWLPDETPPGASPLTLHDIVHRFKSLTTARYRQGVLRDAWPAFNGRLWQRNYYEHIVRNDDDLARIRQYIAENPARWHEDRDNPHRDRP